MKVVKNIGGLKMEIYHTKDITKDKDINLTTDDRYDIEVIKVKLLEVCEDNIIKYSDKHCITKELAHTSIFYVIIVLVKWSY